MFNTFNDTEKHVYKEYKEWCKVAKEQNPETFQYALVQADLYKQRAMQLPKVKEVLFS